MYKLLIAISMLCLTACMSPVVRQAEQQAKANKIISASLDDRLIAFYAVNNCDVT